MDRRRIVVVGPCGSGKSTLVDRLRRRGLDARVCGQEHSIVRDLWQRSRPDVLVALDVDLDTLRRRRSSGWSAAIYAAQRTRLREAFAAADIVIDSAAHDEEEVERIVLAWLRATPDSFS